MKTRIVRSCYLTVLFILLLGIHTGDALGVANMSIIYHQNPVVGSVVDIKIDSPECGRCDLLRNEIVVKSWENVEDATIYYSHPDGSPADWKFQTYFYDHDKDEWRPGFYDTSTISTDYAAGTLHNESDWLQNLNRGYIDWSGNIDVDKVTVKGYFTLTNATINLKNDGSYLTIYDNLEIDTGATINNVSNGHTSVTFSGINGPIVFNNLTLNGKIKFQLLNSSDIRFNKLSLNPGNLADYIEFLNYAAVNVRSSTSGITLNQSQIPYLKISGSNTTFTNSQANYIEIWGDNNTVKDSTIIGQINVGGTDNVISNNKITMQVVSDYGFNLDRGEAISLGGQNNLAEKNGITSGYPADQEDAIRVFGTDNELFSNNIEAVTAEGNGYKSGIKLSQADHARVLFNTISGMSYAGIRLTNSTTNSEIHDNPIENVVHGIEVQASSDNEIGPWNTIITSSNYGLYLYSLSDNVANNNNIHDNTLINTAYGIGLGCVAGVCSNDESTVAGNSFRDNKLNNRDITGSGKDCSLVELQEGVTETTFYGNYIVSGCDIGRFLGIDLGDSNEFFHNVDGGNYWDNYTGTDGDDIDTFGDTSYDIYGNTGNVTNQDQLPLIFHSASKEITPEYIDFGSLELLDGTAVDIGEAKVTIKNTDTEWPLFIYKMYFSGTDWDLFSCENSCQMPIKLEPGERYEVTLTYSPDEVGTHTAYFNIVHSEFGGIRTRMSLFGKGQDKEGDVTGIRGQVTDGAAGIANVRVNAYVPNDTTTPAATTLTNASGNYILTGLSTGDYLVQYNASNTGFVSEWYDDKTSSASADSVAVTFAQVSQGFDAVLTTQTFTVTPAVTGGSGTISPDANQTANYGDRLTFNLTPDNNHTIRRVEGTCGGFLNNTTFTTNSITGDCTVNVVFASDATHNVTPSVSGGNGTIAPDTVQTVNDQTTVQFILTPADGSFIDKVTGTCGGTLYGTKYTTIAVRADCTVIAHFAKKGDINNDGIIDLTDAVLANRILTGLELNGEIFTKADVNDDGSIGLPEAIYILQSIAQ